MDDEVLVNEIACIITNARNNVIKKVLKALQYKHGANLR